MAAPPLPCTLWQAATGGVSPALAVVVAAHATAWPLATAFAQRPWLAAVGQAAQAPPRPRRSRRHFPPAAQAR